MGSLVITVIGNDRAGLVSALSEAIARHDGNWDRSHMSELAGKFAGIVLVTVPDDRLDAVVADLDEFEATGLLDITVERAIDAPSSTPSHRLELRLVGQDHPGIVRDVSEALARRGVSIDELETETVPAPMGGHLFQAEAVLDAPATVDLGDLQATLEAVAHDLMVDLDLTETPT